MCVGRSFGVRLICHKSGLVVMDVLLAMLAFAFLLGVGIGIFLGRCFSGRAQTVLDGEATVSTSAVQKKDSYADMSGISHFSGDSMSLREAENETQAMATAIYFLEDKCTFHLRSDCMRIDRDTVFDKLLRRTMCQICNDRSGKLVGPDGLIWLSVNGERFHKIAGCRGLRNVKTRMFSLAKCRDCMRETGSDATASSSLRRRRDD